MKFLDSVPGDRSRVKKKRQKMKIIIITAKIPASRRWRLKRLDLFLLLWWRFRGAPFADAAASAGTSGGSGA